MSNVCINKFNHKNVFCYRLLIFESSLTTFTFLKNIIIENSIELQLNKWLSVLCVLLYNTVVKGSVHYLYVALRDGHDFFYVWRVVDNNHNGMAFGLNVSVDWMEAKTIRTENTTKYKEL